VDLEQQLQRQKEKVVGLEEQMRKLENKITLSDITLANQVRLSLGFKCFS
jgi:rRNA processing protein Krr1/Pno1